MDPFHISKLLEQTLSVLLQMLECDLVRNFAAKEKLGEKFIFREAFWYLFLQPLIEFALPPLCQTIDFAVGPRGLYNLFHFDESGLLQVFECCINLAIACVPVAGQGAIKGLLDVVAAHWSGPEQSQDNIT